MSQLSFDFDPAFAPAPERAAPASRRPATKAARGKSLSLSLEDMARQLESSADYRVLRRLAPVSDYGQGPDTGPRILILDTETTGLTHGADKIIELAMLLVRMDASNGMPTGQVQTFEGFEDPGMPIPEIARQVTGITDEMVQGQRLDDDAVHALLAQADLVIAHNAGFDRPFMEARFPAFADKAWACSFMDIDWKAMGAESARLGALAQDRGWFYDAHRALVDCHALLQVLACALPCAENSGSAGTGLLRLWQAAQAPSFRLKATGAPFDSKDLLKARGYRWDAQARVWHCRLNSEQALADELAWLKEAVYGGRQAQVEVERQEGATRYSLRPGALEWHSV